jgi:hypothetical protein
MIALEFGLARLHWGGTAAPFIGLAMAAVVAMGFMRLPAAPGLARVFAMAGIFRLAVLLGLGSLDRATRDDIRIPYSDQR